MFRGIDRWGEISKRGLDPKIIYDILKRRADLPRSIWENFPTTACAPVFLPTQSTATFPSAKPWNSTGIATLKKLANISTLKGEADRQRGCLHN